VPKAAKDTLLNTRTRPAPNALTHGYARSRERLKEIRRRGAVVWHVEVAAVTDPPPEPGDPYVEASFQVAEFKDGALAVVGWALTGTSDVRLSESSRFPLRTYARAAILAVLDALDATPDLTYEQIKAQRRTYIGGYEVIGGRLTDKRTHTARTVPKHAHATNGAGRLDLDRVVDAYREAIERGSRSPTVDVAHAFDVGRSTAARSLAEARRQGLLGQALRTRAGERPTPS
jgi:hypothetical protein